MKAINIKWDVDEDTIIDTFNNFVDDLAIKILGIPLTEYLKMSSEDRKSYVLSTFRHQPAKMSYILNEFGISEEIEIPETLLENYYLGNLDDFYEDVSDWLSNEYGFCHSGFNIIYSEKDIDYKQKEIDKLKSLFYNAVLCLLENGSYHSLIDEDFKDMICEETGITKTEYEKLIEL